MEEYSLLKDIPQRNNAANSPVFMCIEKLVKITHSDSP